MSSMKLPGHEVSTEQQAALSHWLQEKQAASMVVQLQQR